MRLAWAIVGGLLAGGGVAWHLAREPADAVAAREARAQDAAMAIAEDARPGLYRWRDEAGVVHVTQEPPPGRPAEKIDLQPRDGIEVDGSRH